MNLIEAKKFYDEKGYVHLKNFFNQDSLQNLIESSLEAEKKALIGNWKYIKIYREYPKIKYLNVFGIECPLHASLNKDTYKNFNKLEYKNSFCKILGWKDFKTTLIRLQTNSTFFNYQGEWHRDNLEYPSPNKIQCLIYLEDEKGFKIVPKNKNYLLKDFGFPVSKPPIKGQGFKKLSPEIYDIIDVKKGDLFIFESSLLHQGFVKRHRLHYHVRHEKIENEEIKVQSESKEKNYYNFIDKFLPDYDLSGEFYAEHYFKSNIKLSIIRFKTLLLYFFPRFRQIFGNLFLKKKDKNTIFHSTIWQ